MADNKEETSVLSENNSVSSYIEYIKSWKMLRPSLYVFVWALISVNVLVALCFSLKSFPPTIFELHIALTVVGYQLLMGHGILALAKHNGWSTSLSFDGKRRAHWVLQLVGSIMAIVGSRIMMVSKENDELPNFDTLHGKFALGALLCTYCSLLNGLLSLYNATMGRLMSAKAVTMSHIVVGVLAFAFSSISLAFGYLKQEIVEWSSNELSYFMICVTVVSAVIILYIPSDTIVRKMYRFVKRKTR